MFLLLSFSIIGYKTVLSYFFQPKSSSPGVNFGYETVLFISFLFFNAHLQVTSASFLVSAFS